MTITPFALVVTAAGSSTRFNNQNIKKEFLCLENGHTVLYNAASPFYAIPGLQAVVVTAKEGTEDETKAALEDLTNQNIPTYITTGGKTRSESVTNALLLIKDLNINTEYVAIHDGARPYIKSELINNIITTAVLNTAAVPAIRITDSVRRIDSKGSIVDIVDRTNLVSVQTPQVFNFKLLLEAIEKNEDINATDEAQVYLNAGHNVTICDSDDSNRKITFESDIPDVEKQIENYKRKNLKD